MMNFTRLNEIFCKEVVNELEKIHKHRHVFVLEPQWFMYWTPPLSAIVYEQHFHILECSTSIFVHVFLQDYHMQDFQP